MYIFQINSRIFTFLGLTQNNDKTILLIEIKTTWDVVTRFTQMIDSVNTG
jgi:hypothetical protein